ncbi:3-phosphoshikimate 1-carboxyvinyltransferase [Rothia kristinae]|uniref:3-phosphoshikimate 1-carboxyvinyltransferase n=1 Tax=Rothia kristinae TaxID=37923 RepID=UPI0034443D6A
MSPRHPASDPQPHHPDPAGVTEHTTSASADPIPDPWPAPHRGTEGPVRAVVAVPGSKSLTNRHLLLAAIADAPMRIRGALDSRDSRLMIDALRALGARIEQEGRDLLITPVPEEPSGQPAVIDAGLAGTIMRFIPPLAAALGRGLVLDGDAAARKRPMGPVLEAVRQLGARVHEDGEAGALPVRIVPGTGPAASELRIDASGSSQFLSGVLLAAALLPGGLTVRHVGEQLPSVPHVRMTVQVLAEYGIDVAHPDPTTWVVPAGRPRAHDAVIEPDLSNAGPFLAAAVVTGGDVEIPDWPQRTTQGGDAWRELLPRFGASVRRTPDGGLRVTGPAGGARALTAPGEIDLRAAGEIAPTVAAIAALCPGTTRLSGIAHLRGHETDRLAALAAELTRLGAGTEETADGLVITGPAHRAARMRTYEDHRMATAAAVLGLIVPGVLVENVATTGKTLPDFPGLWRRMLGEERA